MRTSKIRVQHVLLPLRGVAVHINAFNFPAWGMVGKAAVAWLAGVPVLSKPATSTSLLAHRIDLSRGPVFVEGVDADLVRFIASVRAEPTLIETIGPDGCAIDRRSVRRAADGSPRSR